MRDRQERDEQILKAFRRDGSVERLVQEYWYLVFSAVRQILIFHEVSFTNEDVEELRTEVFLQLFKNDCRRLRQYDEKKGLSLSSWITLIANQTTLNEIKKKGLMDIGKRNFQVQVEDIEGMLKHDEADRLEARESLRLTLDAMEKLSPRDKEVIRQYFLECRCLKEIAASIRKSYGTTATIISRARQRLRKMVGKIET